MKVDKKYNLLFKTLILWNIHFHWYCYDFSNVWKIRRLKDGWYHLKSWGNKLRIKFDEESNGETILKVNYYDWIDIPDEHNILGFQKNTGYAEFKLSNRDISQIMPACEWYLLKLLIIWSNKSLRPA